MVQEAGLDLSRAAARFGLALGLAAGVGGLAHAQPLVPNPGLTTLLQPQRLDRSRPLVPGERSAGTQSGLRPDGVPGGAPCTRSGSAATTGYPAAPAGPSLYGSGSGPGDYGRYVPGAPPPADPSVKKAPATQSGTSRTAAVDRPLYGGTDRPLWDTGERRAAAAKAPERTAPTSEPGKDPASAGPPQPSALPTPVRDRPLWAEGSLSGLPNPVTGPGAEPGTESTAGIGGIAPSPCPASPPP